MAQNENSTRRFEALIRSIVDHLEHVLPGQAPIQDFVHHNTLHGFQHLPFAEALEAARKVTGANGFLPLSEFRDFLQTGRVTRDDLLKVIDNDPTLQADTVIAEFQDAKLYRRDVLQAVLCHPFQSVTGSQLNWQVEEMQAFGSFQADVSPAFRRLLLQRSGKDTADSIQDLWSACLEKLDLAWFLFHPEELTDLSPAQAEAMLTELDAGELEGSGDLPLVHQMVRNETNRILRNLIIRVGEDYTLRGLLLMLTGHDLLDEIRPRLIRFTSSWLDLGIAAWHSPGRETGFYAAWRQTAMDDLGRLLDDLPEWRDELEILPDDPVAVIVNELQRLNLLPEAQWGNYLQHLALELPGWSGMFNWRHRHPEYEENPTRIDMADYLAVRLVMERIFARQLCRRLWQVDAGLSMLRWYFGQHRSELYIRYHLYNHPLPEYLTNLAEQLTSQPSNPKDNARWGHLADLIWTWLKSPAADHNSGHTVYRSAWRLFRLAQHLGLSAIEIKQLDDAQIEQLFACLDLAEPQLAWLFLQAYENHYRDQLFNAVVQNHGRGRWAERKQRPEAQIVFCMDDREESIRRHLEESNPKIETMGAAGFFGVAINWQGLDDQKVTPLCPIVVTPAHAVKELPREAAIDLAQRHQQRRALRLVVKNILHHESRRNLLSSAAVILAGAPLALLTLLGKLFMPLTVGRLSSSMQQRFDLQVPTDVLINAVNDMPATVEQPRLGFTDTEQADRVTNFLRTIGLRNGFGKFVVLMGHGSGSQNNPHLAAYDCGACSGRHGGPNARTFAAMANRPEVRALLKERGLVLADDCWFIGAEHNTCDDSITWYDTDRIPAGLHKAFSRLQSDLYQASLNSAHERCRRFASAPDNPGLFQALRHVKRRSLDFSQTRPELGHATNAAAFIGRRSLSQGAFFDRRVFLISYNPLEDPDGAIVEAILLAAGPVGAGINLEYYFSTVNNEQYGCGTKITHNVTGLYGVMEGTGSDLRTGLPKQMVEIHEAMRLQILVEATTDILGKIYARQPVLQELVGNGWVLLSAKDPCSEQIQVFVPGRGFIPWQGKTVPLKTVSQSADWYFNQSGPQEPVLIKQKGKSSHV
ncbi:MAG: DUF2309 domain-containing protein [Gammaproteobacteria bacterium]|nr:DUF2309 domain-containing protein [Gammaproteobacteria bacterium]MDH5653397.1 DUF2309 domain-containing protein [Gammaproteobacteria bacterium]